MKIAPVTAYLGLGANLGDPVQQIVDARSMLSSMRETQSVRCSSMYLSSPVGYSEQADFVNCVMELATLASINELFAFTQKVESQLGRVREPNDKNAARRIDIDLLLFGEQSSSLSTLTVPHPRMTERLFVLQPLAELLPSARHPMIGELEELLKNGEFANQTVCRLSI